jgi:hypothetical protein
MAPLDLWGRTGYIEGEVVDATGNQGTKTVIVVRKHKGRSGMSVFEWRVYSVTGGPKEHNTQLGKYRTQEAAERAAEHYRANEVRVAAVWAKFREEGKA